jgi:hypothetical protein
MDIESRKKYYLGCWSQPITVYVPDHVKNFKQNKLYFYNGPTHTNVSNFPFHYGTLSPGFWWSNNIQKHIGLLDISCLTISADGYNNEGLPAIVKVRLLGDISGGILGPFAYVRHWGLISEARRCLTPWRNKISSCVWRGVPTGCYDPSKNHRILFCQKYWDKYNIGLTPLQCLQTWGRFPSQYIKPTLSVAELLQYKYIISLPGNDKDSGLNWKLASNSLVIMPPPIYESWLMEGLLKPYEHYVPLAADCSDLPQVLEWCNTHENECLRIIAIANAFMRQFDNNDVEKQIFQNIKTHYVNNVSFTNI